MNISTDEHPRYLAAYAASLTLGHVIAHALCHPSTAGGTLSDGQVDVNGHRYANKMVGTLHACVLAVVAVRCFVTTGFDLRAARLLEVPPLEHLTVGLMLVYLVYDTCFLLGRFFVLAPSRGAPERWTFGEHTLSVAHHLLGFVSWWLVYGGTGGVYWAQCIHLAELSTPLLNVRWIMIKEGITSGPLYLAGSALFLVVFFLSRIPTTAVLLYYMYMGVEKWPSRSIAWFQFMVTLSFWGINLIWFWGGMKLVLRALKGKSGKGKKEE